MTSKSPYARKAKWMPFLMVPLFLIGATLIYHRIAYERTDFFAENFQRYPIPSSLSEDESIRPALEALAAGDHGIAVDELSHRYHAMKDPDIGMQLAMALIGSRDHWAAITVLEEVKGTSQQMKAPAEWYKILCLIALEEKEDAKAMIDYYCEQPDFDFNGDRALRLKDTY